jgi:hypothetical protein
MVREVVMNMNPRLRAWEARVNVTWEGQNGDLPDPVDYNASDAQILTWVTEALQGGGVGGVRSDRRARVEGYVVDRFPATPQQPWHRIFVRPKTPFG